MKQRLSDRTRYSMKNAGIAMASKIIAIVFGFFARMVFTHTLSMEYAGINGLYTNILGALNAANLGIGTALVYTIYDPIARGDILKQRALMKLYDRICRIVALIVAAIGLIMYPVLRVLLKNTGDVENIFVIYGMFLAATILSYFMMYRSMIFLANQRNYVNDMIDSLFLVIQNIVQMAVLALFRNYYLYLLIYVLAVPLRNYVIAYHAKRDYPDVFVEGEDSISEQESAEVFRNIRAMLMHKVGTVVINNIDNLTLTGIVGITAVGMYSNYYLIIGSIRQIIDRIVFGIAGSVGNLGATENSEHVRKVFLGTFFMVAVGYGMAAIALYELVSVFVSASFGPEYVFPKLVTFILCTNFFFNGLRQASLIFRDSLGLFWHDRYKTMIESLVNLIASIILARKMGTAGVFFGTLVSIVGISMWVEPLVLYREYFHAPVREYFLRLFRYTVMFAAAWGITDFVNRIIPWPNEIAEYCGMIGICMLIPAAILIGLNAGSEEFRFVMSHLRLKKGG